MPFSPALGSDDVLNAWIAWLATQAAPLNIPAFKWGPPEPYTGDYPLVIVTAQSQTTVPQSGSSVQESGTYRLFYTDMIDATYSNRADLLTGATRFADALERALAAERSMTPGASNLDGAVVWAGLGQGITKAFSDLREGDDADMFRVYALPIDISVMEYMKNG